jgi:hypothetical protein
MYPIIANDNINERLKKNKSENANAIFVIAL